MLKLKLPAFLKKPNFKNRKTLGLSFLLIVILGFVGWAFFNDTFKDNRKVYAQAAGHKVYEDELRGFIGDNKNVNDHDAAKVLADKYLVEALAKEQEITVTDKDIMTEYEVDIRKQKNKNEYQYQLTVNQIYFDKLANFNKGIYKGKYLVTHFSRFVPYKSPLLYEDKQMEPRIGNKAAIAKDKKYAEDLITRLYNQIESGEITFNEAIRNERNDPKVGLKAYPTLSHSSEFDTITDPYTFMGNQIIRQQLGELKAGETSKPTVIKVSNSSEPSEDDLAESYFLVVRLEKASGNSGKSFEQYLKDAKERLEYEVNV